MVQVFSRDKTRAFNILFTLVVSFDCTGNLHYDLMDLLFDGYLVLLVV